MPKITGADVIVWPMSIAAKTGSTKFFLLATLFTILILPITLLPAFFVAIYQVSDAIANKKY